MEQHKTFRPDMLVNEAPGSMAGEGGVFLSPRVLDRAAFEEFGARLREMLERVEAAAGDLRAAHEQAAGAHRGAREITQKHRAALDASAKILKALTAQTEAGANLVDRLDGAAERAAAEIDRVVSDGLERAERAMDERVARLERTLATIERRRAESEVRMQQQIDDNIGVLAETYEQAARLAGWDPQMIEDGAGVGPPAEGSLGDLVRRGESTLLDAESMRHRLETTHAEATRAIEQLGASLEGSRELLGALEDKREATHAHLADVCRRAERASEELSDRMARIADVEERVAEVSDEIEKRVNDAERARSLAEEAVDAARDAVEALGTGSPERLRAEVGEELNEAAEALSRMARRLTELEKAGAEGAPPTVVVRARDADTVESPAS